MAEVTVFYFYRGHDRCDSRACVEITPDELCLRVDDDNYDCEMTRQQALTLARAIIEAYDG